MNRTDAVLRGVEDLAATQLGVFGRHQALALGATARVIEGRVAAGAWVLELPRVYRVAAVRTTRAQRAMAAGLWAAPDGLVSYETAGWLWRYEGVVGASTHVTIQRGRGLHSDRVVVHRTSDLLPADVARIGPIPVTSALRTAIDLAAVLEAGSLEVAIESALRRRLFSVGQLRWRADALMSAGRPGLQVLRKLLDSHQLGQTDSRWEVRTARALEAAGLGPPARQHPIRSLTGKLIATADLAYPDAHVVIEYDSDEWHHGVARRHHDAERRNQLRALGWTVVEVTAAQLRDRTRFVAVVRTLLAA